MTPATLRSVWFSITTATEDTALPIPTGVNLYEFPGRAPIVSLTFGTADDAQTWAVWVDHEHTSVWGDRGTVTFMGRRMGWHWQLSCHVPSERSLPPQEQKATSVNERLLVPCGRCGHGENRHQHAPGHATACLDCPGAFCRPVLVRTGGGADRTIVDAEDEVE